MHQVLFKDTYDSSSIQALKVIAQEQQQLEQELCSAIQQVRHALRTGFCMVSANVKQSCAAAM